MKQEIVTTIINEPKDMALELLTQLIELVEKGGQVERKYIEKGIRNAALIAVIVENNIILSSAALKSPLISYRKGVFQKAGVEDHENHYLLELGYITTNPDYENKKLCQKLLKAFFKSIGNKSIYATTRKPSMAHILKKFGFRKAGKTYNKDLELFIYDGKK